MVLQAVPTAKSTMPSVNTGTSTWNLLVTVLVGTLCQGPWYKGRKPHATPYAKVSKLFPIFFFRIFPKSFPTRNKKKFVQSAIKSAVKVQKKCSKVQIKKCANCAKTYNTDWHIWTFLHFYCTFSELIIALKLRTFFFIYFFLVGNDLGKIQLFLFFRVGNDWGEFKKKFGKIRKLV